MPGSSRIGIFPPMQRLLVIVLLASAPSVLAEPCGGSALIQFESRYGRAAGARTPAELQTLVEVPTILNSRAVATREGEARIETSTETHAVYPVLPAKMMETLRDDAALSAFMPSLAEHETLCDHTSDFQRQRQRTDFGVLVFTLGTEYVIDVQHVYTGPDVYASRWALVESLDARLGYLYGSWYFEEVEIDGQTMTYVRHYLRSGLTTRVPGVRAFVGSRIEQQIIDLFTAFYQEVAERHGTTSPSVGVAKSSRVRS